MSCSGNGECITQTSCGCTCFDNCTCYDNCECTCSHQNDCPLIVNPDAHKECRGGYCFADVAALNCCSLSKCRNSFCNEVAPEWYFDCHSGSCWNCNKTYGRIDPTNTIGECVVCFEANELYTIKCGLHTICIECIQKINKMRGCPLCRTRMW